MDSLCLKILELDSLTLVEHEPSDGETDMDEQVSCVFQTSAKNLFIGSVLQLIHDEGFLLATVIINIIIDLFNIQFQL